MPPEPHAHNRRRRRSTLLVLLLVCVGACSNPAETRRAESVSPVLVPTDEAFRPEFAFTLNVAPEIYDVFSNVDSEFNARIDKTLAVQGWQINDLDAWHSATPGESDRDRQMLSTVVDAARAEALGETTSSCELLEGQAGIYGCATEGPRFLVRFIETPGRAPLLLLPDSAAAERYLNQDFDVVAIASADAWFTSTNP